MPKRSRVREATLLGMLDEEEIVSEAQPELAKKDEDGRATKKQKRDHYRRKMLSILPIAAARARKVLWE